MKLFLTGATGFLGSHVAEEVARRGHQISALARSSEKERSLAHLPVRWLRGSLTDLPRLEADLQGIEGIVHMAGVIKALSKDDFFRANAEGTRTLVKTAARLTPAPRVFLYASTLAVHHVPPSGGDFHVPTDECHPLSDYGRSKLEGEKTLSDLPSATRRIILRPPPLYGPRDSEFLPLFQSARYGFAPLWGRGRNRMSMCYATDVACAIADLVERPPAADSIFCIDDGEEYTWKDLLHTLSQASGKKVKGIPLPPLLFYTGAVFSQSWARLRRQPTILTLDKLKEMGQENWVCGHGPLYQATGWNPQVKLEEGFRKTWDYYREKGLL